jgi:hypothetical protein
MMLRKAAIVLIVAIGVILFKSTCAFSQAPMNFETMDHVYQEWLGRGACDTMYYADKIDKEVIDSTISRIAKKTSYSLSVLYRTTDREPFIITKEEQVYLISELKKLENLKWPDKMFPNSKMVSSKDIKNVFKVTKQYPKEKADNCSIIFTFSKPIYFRNNTICLYLNQEQYSNTEIQLTYNFYIKIDGEWEGFADCYINMGVEGDGN